MSDDAARERADDLLTKPIFGIYPSDRDAIAALRDALAAERERTRRLEEALESLAGDVYLYFLGEITREQLLASQSAALASAEADHSD